MNLIEHIIAEIELDDENLDDDQSMLLAEAYQTADDAGKAVIDRVFVCLCGWTLKTLLERQNTGAPA